MIDEQTDDVFQIMNIVPDPWYDSWIVNSHLL